MNLHFQHIIAVVQQKIDALLHHKATLVELAACSESDTPPTSDGHDDPIDHAIADFQFQAPDGRIIVGEVKSAKGANIRSPRHRISEAAPEAGSAGAPPGADELVTALKGLEGSFSPAVASEFLKNRGLKVSNIHEALNRRVAKHLLVRESTDGKHWTYRVSTGVAAPRQSSTASGASFSRTDSAKTKPGKLHVRKPVELAVLEVLPQLGPQFTCKGLCASLDGKDIKKSSVRQVLDKLCDKGRLRKVDRGVYEKASLPEAVLARGTRPADPAAPSAPAVVKTPPLSAAGHAEADPPRNSVSGILDSLGLTLENLSPLSAPAIRIGLETLPETFTLTDMQARVGTKKASEWLARWKLQA
jgi:hypothetical protein